MQLSVSDTLVVPPTQDVDSSIPEDVMVRQMEDAYLDLDPPRKAHESTQLEPVCRVSMFSLRYLNTPLAEQRTFSFDCIHSASSGGQSITGNVYLLRVTDIF